MTRSAAVVYCSHMTTTTVDPRVSLLFASKGASRTKWIEVTFPTDAEPSDMFDDLRAAGWVYDDYGLPPTQARDDNFKSLGYAEQFAVFTKKGTDLFVGWTDAEKTANMAEARSILRKYGFSRVPVWKKTLADML